MGESKGVGVFEFAVEDAEVAVCRIGLCLVVDVAISKCGSVEVWKCGSVAVTIWVKAGVRGRGGIDMVVVNWRWGRRGFCWEM